MTAVSEVAATIQTLRREVCALHAQLTRYQLVVWRPATSRRACRARTCC